MEEAAWLIFLILSLKEHRERRHFLAGDENPDVACACLCVVFACDIIHISDVDIWLRVHVDVQDNRQFMILACGSRRVSEDGGSIDRHHETGRKSKKVCDGVRRGTHKRVMVRYQTEV